MEMRIITKSTNLHVYSIFQGTTKLRNEIQRNETKIEETKRNEVSQIQKGQQKSCINTVNIYIYIYIYIKFFKMLALADPEEGGGN